MPVLTQPLPISFPKSLPGDYHLSLGYDRTCRSRSDFGIDTCDQPSIKQEDYDFDFFSPAMSNYYYPTHPSTSQPDEQYLEGQIPTHIPSVTQGHDTSYPSYHLPANDQQLYDQTQAIYETLEQYPETFGVNQPSYPTWNIPDVPSNDYPYNLQHQHQQASPFAQYAQPSSASASAPTYSNIPNTNPITSLSQNALNHLSPDPSGAHHNRHSRATSLVSNAHSTAPSDISRSDSPKGSEMLRYGLKNANGTWSCAFPGCTSQSAFYRGCDLRKHYKRHSKTLYCRHEGCAAQSEGQGFSSKKDRARHEAKHDPQIVCQWPECGRVFSRQDNMQDHVRRVHEKVGARRNRTGNDSLHRAGRSV